MLKTQDSIKAGVFMAKKPARVGIYPDQPWLYVLKRMDTRENI